MEVSALSDADETTAGDIWRRLKEGKTQQQIADEDGITIGPVYSAMNLHNALVTGTVSSSPTVARAVAGRIRTWLKTKSLSEALRLALEEQERLLNAVVENTQASEAESEEALEKSEAAVAENIAGIYVYTLPHYVRYPYDPGPDAAAEGRALFCGRPLPGQRSGAGGFARRRTLGCCGSTRPRPPPRRRSSSTGSYATPTMTACAARGPAPSGFSPR